MASKRYARRTPRRQSSRLDSAKCTEFIQDVVAPAAKDKGKEKSAVADARSLSLAALRTMVDDEIRKVADLTGLKVRLLPLRHTRARSQGR